MRRFLRHLIWSIVIMTGLGALVVLVAGLVLLQDQPALSARAAPDGANVADTRALVRNLRDAAASPDGLLRTDATQINSALQLGARFLPGFRGEIETNEAHVTATASVPVPWPGGARWLNITGRAPEFSDGLALSDVTIGDRNLPPALVLWVARVGANLALGEGLGDTAMTAAQGLQIDGETLTLTLRLDDMGKNGLMRGTFGALHGDSLPTAAEVETYHSAIRAAMADGRLAQTGSFMPYLQFALDAAQNGTSPDTVQQRYAAAILGLAKVCGAQDFSLIVGRLVFSPTEPQDWQTGCADVTLNGRDDSRRHFISSAALQAISNTGFSVSAGEFKELYDTISGAGGFDFTDMAANLSGIQLTNTMMAAPADAWPALIARLDSERAIIPDFDGIPPLMPQAEFEARFIDIDSPPYQEMIALIEARIDDLGLYGPQ